MSIHFISGKPGGGKTLYSVKLIMEELVHGSRVIVTNVPLKLDQVNEYLQTQHPKAYGAMKGLANLAGGDLCAVAQTCERDCLNEELAHISNRIVIIGDEEMARFFTFRGQGVRLETVTNENWRSGKRPDYSLVKDAGVFYVLDEIHIAFNSRAWALTGNEVLYYLSQHRKLGDDVVCITQSIGNVDKQFRSVAQDYTYIRNLSKQRAGIFKLPFAFLRSTYAQPATETSKPMESGMFRLDVTGLASCYDTAKGVGIHGRAGADKGHKRKGFHLLWAIIGIPIIIFVVVHYLPRLFVAATKPVVPAHSRMPSKPVPGASFVPNGDNVPENSVGSLSKPVERAAEEETKAEVVFCRGYILGKFPKVFLSDGRTAEAEFGEVQSINRQEVFVFGSRFKIRAAPSEYHPETFQVGEVPFPNSRSYSVNSGDNVHVSPAIHGQGGDSPPALNGIGSMPGGRF